MSSQPRLPLKHMDIILYQVQLQRQQLPLTQFCCLLSSNNCRFIALQNLLSYVLTFSQFAVVVFLGNFHF